MVQESCSIYSKSAEWWVQGKSFYGGDTRRSPSDVSAKFLRALDLQTGKIAWEIPDLGGGILASGVMSTAGGLVFYGDSPGGAFVAADAATGKHLWHFNTGQSWKAGPMTYMRTASSTSAWPPARPSSHSRCAKGGDSQSGHSTVKSQGTVTVECPRLLYPVCQGIAPPGGRALSQNLHSCPSTAADSRA